MRILVVDDESVVRDVTTKMLARLGHDVDAVSGGPDAIEAYTGQPYDMVLLDLMMPVMDGSECFDALRKLDPQARIFVTTGLGDGPMAQALVQRGAAGVIAKPFTIPDLQRVTES